MTPQQRKRAAKAFVRDLFKQTDTRIEELRQRMIARGLMLPTQRKQKGAKP